MENREWSLCGKRLSDEKQVAGDECSALALKQLPGRERNTSRCLQVAERGEGKRLAQEGNLRGSLTTARRDFVGRLKLVVVQERHPGAFTHLPGKKTEPQGYPNGRRGAKEGNSGTLGAI